MAEDRFEHLEINPSRPSPAPGAGSESVRDLPCPKCGALNEKERETCWECFSLLNGQGARQASMAQERPPAGLDIRVPAVSVGNRILFFLAPGPFLLFCLYALNGWTFRTFSFPLQELAKGEFFYPAFYAAGASFVVGLFLWMLFGREGFAITGSTLILRQDVFGIGWSRRFDAAKVGGLRADRRRPGLYFDYGGVRINFFGFEFVSRQRVRFFCWLGEAERERLLDQITDRCPDLTSNRPVA